MIYKKFITRTITSSICLSSLLLLNTASARAETPIVDGRHKPPNSIRGTRPHNHLPNSLNLIESQEEGSIPAMSQNTKVHQLRDVKSNDWAYEALRSLVDRYGCIAGYPDQTFQGDRTLTRWEFAAGLNACIQQIERLIAASESVIREDLEKIQRLEKEFEAELASLAGRVDNLEGRIAFLEDHQFSTTTKLRGQVIVSVNAGGFDGDRIVDPSGMQELANSNPQATVLYRAGLDLTTSFFGTDSLLIRLEGASGSTINGFRGVDNAAAVLEPFFGSPLDYSAKPPTEDGDLGIGRLVYTFKPIPDLAVSLGPDIRATDYADRNSYANLSFLDFSSQLFVNNLILFPIDGPAGGAAIDWQPGKGSFAIRALYAAAEANNPGGEQIRPIIGTAPFIRVLFPQETSIPNAGGDLGLFGDTYQGTVEVEYSPTRNFALRLQYSGGELFNNHFDVISANVEFTLAPQLGLFSRYGYGSYDKTRFGDIEPHYWMAGIASRDLFREGALAGLAVGQPFIASEIGDATQTNYEVFYNYPLNRNIQISPSIQIITNAGNQDSNGTIVTGTMRTVFSF